MPDEEDDDKTVIQHRDDEMTHPGVPREAVSEPTIPGPRAAPARGAKPAPRPQPLPAMRPRAPTLKPPVEAPPAAGAVRPRAPSIPPPAPRPRASSRPDTPPMRPPQRSSSEEIADAIASAMVAAQVPAAFQLPLVVPEEAPAPVGPAPIASPHLLAAPAPADGASGAPGWVVLYVFVCIVLTALGAAVLVWWKLHGLW